MWEDGRVLEMDGAAGCSVDIFNGLDVSVRVKMLFAVYILGTRRKSAVTREPTKGYYTVPQVVICFLLIQLD